MRYALLEIFFMSETDLIRCKALVEAEEIVDHRVCNTL